MLESLPLREGETDRDPRIELDSQLGVAGWSVPGRRVAAVSRPPEVPDWWGGDEEASQSFIQALGVRLE